MRLQVIDDLGRNSQLAKQGFNSSIEFMVDGLRLATAVRDRVQADTGIDVADLLQLPSAAKKARASGLPQGELTKPNANTSGTRVERSWL